MAAACLSNHSQKQCCNKEKKLAWKNDSW